jgi:hypothetical protein
LLPEAQRTEETEHVIYTKLAARSKDPKNAEVLARIGAEELKHAKFWESKTGKSLGPDWIRMARTIFLAKILGLTFVLKQMERREGTGARLYDQLAADYPDAAKIAAEEAVHEKELVAMLVEERLHYVGSVVLGLNDALVELTGSLAGFTLALGQVCPAKWKPGEASLKSGVEFVGKI